MVCAGADCSPVDETPESRLTARGLKPRTALHPQQMPVLCYQVSPWTGLHRGELQPLVEEVVPAATAELFKCSRNLTSTHEQHCHNIQAQVRLHAGPEVPA